MLKGDIKYNFKLFRLKELVHHFRQFFYNSPRCIITYFINGLIIIIPLAVTLWLLVWVFNLVDGMLAPVLNWAFGRPIIGLGFVTVIFLVLLIGYLGIKLGRRKVFDLFELQVTRIPVIGTIYGSTRQVLENFTTVSNNKFLEVIFMEFPRKGIYTVGLVTSELEDKNGKKLLTVFIPTAPNPTSGFLQIVPESEIVRTSMSTNDAMKLIITAGKISNKEIADIMLQVPESENREKLLVN